VVARILDGTMPESRIDDLNPEQLRAATWRGPSSYHCRSRHRQDKNSCGADGLARVAGIEPARIMLLTFTRVAARRLPGISILAHQHILARHLWQRFHAENGASRNCDRLAGVGRGDVVPRWRWCSSDRRPSITRLGLFLPGLLLSGRRPLLQRPESWFEQCAVPSRFIGRKGTISRAFERLPARLSVWTV
jgi:hypothetical protein